MILWWLVSPDLTIRTSDAEVTDFTPLLSNVNFFCPKPYLKVMGKCVGLYSLGAKVTFQEAVVNSISHFRLS